MWLNDIGLGFLVPYTLKHKEPDHKSLKPASESPKIDYPKPDFIIHAASIASPIYYRKYPIETIDANVTGLRNLLDFF